MRQEPKSAVEQLPELRLNLAYVRCLDRLFQTLPSDVQWRLFQPAIAAAVRTGAGIAVVFGERVPSEPPLTEEERVQGRAEAVEGIRASREVLAEIEASPGADRAELMVARELLERIEGSVRQET